MTMDETAEWRYQMADAMLDARMNQTAARLTEKSPSFYLGNGSSTLSRQTIQ